MFVYIWSFKDLLMSLHIIFIPFFDFILLIIDFTY